MPYLNRQTAISTLLCLTLILSACANSTVPLYEGDPRPIGNPTWITIQVISIEVLRAPGEVDRVNEFRFFLVAGNEDPAYAVGYVYPARNNMAVRVGDVIHTGGTYGLSIDENALDGELYVYMAGIDSDQQSRLVNFGTEAVISLVAEGLAIAVAGGNPAVSFITGYVLSALSDYVQEDDVIGDGLVVLRASERWSAGQVRSFTSDNGALRVTYRVTLSQPGAAEPVYARVVPEPYVQVDDFADPAAFDRNWWVNDPGGVCDLGVAGEELAFDCFNPAKQNWVATLHPRRASDGVTGVSATMWVKESQGAVKPVTNWRCDRTGEERAYHLELGPDTARAVELYPQQGWRSVQLGRISVAPDRPHLLQIERVEGSVEFFVDGQRLPLHTVPDLPACYSLTGWALDFYVWKDGNAVSGQVDQVSLRP